MMMSWSLQACTSRIERPCGKTQHLTVMCTASHPPTHPPSELSCRNRFVTSAPNCTPTPLLLGMRPLFGPGSLHSTSHIRPASHQDWHGAGQQSVGTGQLRSALWVRDLVIASPCTRGRGHSAAPVCATSHIRPLSDRDWHSSPILTGRCLGGFSMP